MTLNKFKTLRQKEPFPAGQNRLLEASWYDGRGDRHTAHRIAQKILEPESS